MKPKTERVNYKISREATAPMVLKEAVALPGIGLSFPVRVAKAKLSALLELVAGGQEITIASDGAPKAVLSPVGKGGARKVFAGARQHLKKMPAWRGGPGSSIFPPADEAPSN